MAKSIFGLFRAPAQVEALENVKALGRWAAQFPANDPTGVAAAIVVLLDESCARQPTATTDRSLALLELDRWSLPLQTQLRSDYRRPVLSDEVRQNLWRTRYDLARGFAQAYERIFEGSRARPEDVQLRAQMHAVFPRLFHYRGMQAQLELSRYEQLIPARWKSLHAAYQAASECGVATLPFSLLQDSRPDERSSAEQEYLQILLLQRLNSGNLSVAQIELASQWLQASVPALRVATTAPQGDQYWRLDPSRPEGLLAAPAQAPEGESLYVDVAVLRTGLNALTTSLTEKLAQGSAGAGTREIKAQLALARRLERLWLPHAQPQPRRGERRAEQQPILVAPGWKAIPVLMRQARPWRTQQLYSYTYDGTAGPAASVGGAEAPGEIADGAAGVAYSDQFGW